MQVPAWALEQISKISGFFANSLAWPLFRWKAWSLPHPMMVPICSMQCVMRWNLVFLASGGLAEEGAFGYTSFSGSCIAAL